jgi:uncharacterized protein YbbC (DUF1343 family)
MRLGIDRLVDEQFAPLHGKRVGLFTNLSTVNRDLITTYDILRNAPQVELAALFGPEHGFAVTAADGVAVGTVTDNRTGVPIYSLYGETYQPTEGMLTNIDVMVCDIQDIGVRYYTYLWSLTYLLEACGAHGVAVLILDRPNPLGGTVDGGPLDSSLSSMVGRYSIPIQHGMTVGELALMINARWNTTSADVTVVPCDGWQRRQRWDQLQQPFIPPSPNMPHFVTALHYPGSCLIEGTTLSEGRGTPLPFEVVGAPFIDGWDLAASLNVLEMPGVRFRQHQFQPTASKYMGKLCHGIQAYITNVELYRPLSVWLTVIRTVQQLYPNEFAWLPPHISNGIQHFDRLIGSAEVRTRLDRREPVETIIADWPTFHQQFTADASPYYLYQ